MAGAQGPSRGGVPLSRPSALGRKRPDIVFTRKRCAIFVHGCFWHGHDCPRGRLPQNNAAFWRAKITRNKERDEETTVTLTSEGWKSMVIWECESKVGPALLERLRSFLGPPSAGAS